MENRNPYNFSNIYFYQSNIPPEHPMCRSNIIVNMVDITKRLVYEYVVECLKSKIWEN